MKMISLFRILWLVSTLAYLVHHSPIALAQESRGEASEQSGSPPPGFEQVTGPGSGHEEVAAAPLVIAAYGLIWALLLAYLVSLWLRQRRIRAELEALRTRIRVD